MENKKKRNFKSILKKLGMVFIVLVVLTLTLPLLVPIKGTRGLSEASELKEENGYFVNIPFEGTDGIETYYTYYPSEDNPDKNFILLHGSLYNTNTWDEITDYLSTKGNVYAYDQAPYGLSEKLIEGDWTGDNPYTIEAAVTQLNNFMDTLSIEDATLVGSSYGGVIAAEAALIYPEKVNELILIDAAIYITESLPEWVVKLPQVEHLGPTISKSLINSDTFYKSTYYDESKLTDEKMFQTKIMNQINNYDLAYWEYLQAWATNPSNVSIYLEEIKIPALVISGSEDEIVPLEQSQMIYENIEGATLEIIESCGHLPHEESPEALIQVLDIWFSKQ